MRLALALAALVVASPGKAQTSHRMTACPEWTSFESYFKNSKAYLDHEFDLFHKMTLAEAELERSRICGAVNASKVLVESMYEQVRICHDKGVSGMDKAADDLAKSVLQARKQVTDTGC